MSAHIQEWLNVLVRLSHVVAAIMWVGDSFLFMWLDSSLSKPETPREGEVVGELWMAHSGGFYEVVKRKSLAALPRDLFFFKWESYTTWITGFLLLVVVYALGGRAMLLDASSPISQSTAVAICLGGLAVATGFYHLLCKTPLIRSMKAFGVLGLGLIVASAYGLSHVFTPRAVFLEVGAMLGTIMASNVFFVIISAQKHMLAATAAGTPVDTSYGARAKQRSTHNHYLTLPVLFMMLSNHFAGLYAHRFAWAVLGLVVVFAVGLKYVMNFRRRTPAWVWAGTAVAFVAVTALTRPGAAKPVVSLDDVPTVSFATTKAIVETRCVTCHAEHPTNPSFVAAPKGVMLDTPERIASHAAEVRQQAVMTRAMPLGNLTGITDDERRYLGGWIEQGAHVDAEGPVQLSLGPSPVVPKASSSGSGPPKAPADPALAAKTAFTERCVMCHGPNGKGDGQAASNLNPKPRNYHDVKWQDATSDAEITLAIAQGGGAVGKSASMPGNPDLHASVIIELVKIVRGFKN